MVDLRLVDGESPVVFDTDGYQLVVMPLFVNNSHPKAPAEPIDEAFPASEEAEPAETERAEAVAEAVVKTHKPKRKHKAKEPVAVA